VLRGISLLSRLPSTGGCCCTVALRPGVLIFGYNSVGSGVKEVIPQRPADVLRGSGAKNVIFSNGPNSTSECSKLLY